MRRCLKSLPQLAVLLSLLIAGAPAGQAKNAPTTAPPPEKATVEPIATGDIVPRADTDERFVQDVMTHATQKDPSAKLEPKLELLSAGVSKLAGRFKSDELLQLSPIRLESLERHWNFYGRQLDLWRRELQRATAIYSADAAELAKRRALWEATRVAADASGVAPALRSRVDAMLAQIALAEQAVSRPLDAQLKLSRRANVLQTGIDSGKRGIAAAIAYYDQRLRMIDSPPLMQVWADPHTSKDATRAAVTGLSIENDFLEEYSLANRDRLKVHKVVAVLLLPLLIWLRRRSRKIVSDDPELLASAKVLLRPISSWLVLVLVGTLLFEPDAPLFLHQVALLAALIPVLRLLPKRLFDVMGPWPYIVTALYVLHGLGFFMVSNPFLYRVNLLIVTVLTLVALVWLLIRRAHMARPEGVSPALITVTRVFGWLSAAAMVVSSIANVLGNVSLAEMLTGAVLGSAYVGLALYAGASVLSAILKLVLARRAAQRFRIVTAHAGPMLRSVSKLIDYAAVAIWLIVTLNEFRIYRPVADWSRGVLTYPLEMGQISVTLGSIVLFVLSIWVAFWLARTIRLVLQDEILPKMALPRGVGNSISTLSYYALVTIGIFVALAAAGFELSQLSIIVGALSLGIGFGLQNVVNNFVSGLILMFERPIQPGDVVEVSGTSGKVRDIGMRATTLTTFEGADVVVPNGTLLSEKLINWTLSDMTRRIDVNLGVAYGSNPRQVMAVLMDVAKGTPGIAPQPEAAVVFTGFGASSLDFGIRAWTHDFDNWVAIRSEMSMRVCDALAAAGIEIPLPQQDVHVRSIDPESRAAWAAAMAPRNPTG